MTIGKKLYVNFGAVLAMVVVLFLVNLRGSTRTCGEGGGRCVARYGGGD